MVRLMKLNLVNLAAICLLALLVLFGGCVSQANANKVKLGVQLTPGSTLAHVADAKGFFSGNELDVEIVEFTAGKFALQALLSKSVDFAVMGEIPPMLAKMQGSDFYILTEVGSNHNEAPVLVVDDGSKTPKEYFSKAKRKISTTLGATPEFSFYLFMKVYGIEKGQVEIIAQKPEEMVGALASSSVDGIAIIEPYPTLAEEKAGKKTIRFLLPKGVYTAKYLLSADKSFVEKNPETAKRLLKALKQAEQFVSEHPEEAKQIVAERTKFDRRIIDKIWQDFDFRTGLSEELLKNLENESQWAIETGKVQNSNKPDFESLLRKDIIESVKD